ncbi:hypothetical protein PCH_Pc21g06480 [Penicillium rubens Wisconsin 54-1255]|uniref:Uncharacterized protein n=2 Tax=Penicillium chrysogenum species complex TaxID=254878 RepID=B6HJB3_PENRW|nr:hypothetical protein PCH_Pc21g06480 [Penicillium rubens Wisconsin 54-1255]
MRGGRDRSKWRTDAIGLLAKLTFWRQIGSQDVPYICRGHVLNFKEQWQAAMEVQLGKLQDTKAYEIRLKPPSGSTNLPGKSQKFKLDTGAGHGFCFGLGDMAYPNHQIQELLAELRAEFSASQHVPPMTLQNLPVEILCIIIRFIGSDLLRKQEACCLSVCKRWYAIAKPLLLEDLKLSATQLVRAPHDVHPQLRIFLRQLTLDVCAPKGWPAEQDIVKLNEILTSLIERNNHLASFTFRVRSEFAPIIPLTRYASWDPTRFLSVLDTSNLSHLVIDTFGSEMINAMHLCPQLAHQIPSLKSVRLRMRRICRRILEFPQSDSVMPSQIESLVINLSIPNFYGFTDGFSCHCTELRLQSELHNEMITTGTEIVKQTPRLKVFKIVSYGHRFPLLETVVMNCITGIKTIIPGRWRWGDEEDPEPDPVFTTWATGRDLSSWAEY